MQLQVLNSVYTSFKKTIFITGTMLLTLVAIRNSITNAVERVWGASQDFWSNLWLLSRCACFENDFIILSIGPYMSVGLAFWCIGGMFMAIDLSRIPLLMQYRVQQNSSPPGLQTYVKILPVLIINNVLGFLTFFVCYPLFKLRGMETGPELPSLLRVMLESCGFMLIHELAFYYTHRLFHIPTVYRIFHKTHHEFSAPIALSCIYCSATEQVFVNILPLLAGPLALGSHAATMWLWLTMVMFNTLIIHSGYHLPLMPSPEAHDYHHANFTENFGSMGVLDHLHGTDVKFRASQSYNRHTVLLSLSPVRYFYPDSQKKE